MPKVSVIIPVHNYGEYLKQAILSVLEQRFADYELIIVNDAALDNSAEILQGFISHPKIKIITHDTNQGFIRSCHEAIGLSNGEYIVRLDADDYFDENALLVLSNVLDNDPEIALVYPDYFLVAEGGVITEHVHLPRVNEDIKLLDIAANGAATMFRKSCYEAVGGYDLTLECQDGYDLWLKLQRRFKVCNVNLPLFYYRRHGNNLTGNSQKILNARRYIKKRFAADERIPKPSALGIIPARANDFSHHLALRKLGGKPLIAYTIEEALKTPDLSRVVCTTEDDGIALVARSYGVEVVPRPRELTQGPIEHTVLHLLEELGKEAFHPEAVVILYTNSPFKQAKHITEVINTLQIFDIDSVVSVCEDKKFHYQHGPYGLNPLYAKRLLRKEKDALYEENGAIYASRTGAITRRNFLGSRLGHIIMTPEESVHIDSEFDLFIAEQMVKEGRA